MKHSAPLTIPTISRENFSALLIFDEFCASHVEQIWLTSARKRAPKLFVEIAAGPLRHEIMREDIHTFAPNKSTFSSSSIKRADNSRECFCLRRSPNCPTWCFGFSGRIVFDESNYETEEQMANVYHSISKLNCRPSTSFRVITARIDFSRFDPQWDVRDCRREKLKPIKFIAAQSMSCENWCNLKGWALVLID